MPFEAANKGAQKIPLSARDRGTEDARRYGVETERLALGETPTDFTPCTCARTWFQEPIAANVGASHLFALGTDELCLVQGRVKIALSHTVVASGLAFIVVRVPSRCA